MPSQISRLGRSGRVALVAVLALIGLHLLGTVLPPAWSSPSAVAEAQRPAAPTIAPSGSDMAVQRSATTVEAEDATLPATVVGPAAQGRHPGVVLVHGAGPQTRSDLAELAEEFARSGIVALTYDKRTAGYGPASRDYEQLAEDALAGVRLLRERTDVDPERVGVWGISEGGWVAPITATLAPDDVAFLVLVSAPVVSPLRQIAFATDARLREADAPFAVRRLMATGWSTGQRFVDYVDHDTVPILERVQAPVLAIYGADDADVPTAESARILTDALSAPYTVRFFEGADHDLRSDDGEYADGYLATITDWVQGLPESATPPAAEQVAGAPSTQRYLTPTIPTLPWFAAGPVRALAVLLVVGGLLAGPIAALVTRRRWTDALAIRRRLRWLASGAIATHLAPFVLIGVVVALLVAPPAPPQLVTVAWLVAQLVAVATVVLGVETADRVVVATRDGWQPTTHQRISLIGVAVASGVVWLFAAYSGLFSLPW